MVQSPLLSCFLDLVVQELCHTEEGRPAHCEHTGDSLLHTDYLTAGMPESNSTVHGPASCEESMLTRYGSLR